MASKPHATAAALVVGLLATVPPAPAGAATPAAQLNLSLACPNGLPMWIPTTIQPPVFAVIIQFITTAAAKKRIKNTELRNGAVIDPAFLNNQRVILQVTPRQKTTALVPAGMIVHLNQAVTFTPAHGDANNPCFYTPNLIVP